MTSEYSVGYGNGWLLSYIIYYCTAYKDKATTKYIAYNRAEIVNQFINDKKFFPREIDDVASVLRWSILQPVPMLVPCTLMTSQGSDTVTAIFKCNSSNTIKSLRLLKMAQFS